MFHYYICIVLVALNKFDVCKCLEYQFYYENDIKKLLHFGKVYMEDPYKVITEGNIIECIKECLVRRRCQSVNYKDRFNLCELNDRSGDTLLDFHGSVYTTISDWDKALAGTCGTNNGCKIHQKCEDSSGHDVCMPSDCGYPPTVRGLYHNETSASDFYSHVEVGCRYGYEFYGNPMVHCQDDGTWTPLLMNCTTVDCGNPPSISHATFELLDGYTLYESPARYQCNNASHEICDAPIELVSGNQTTVYCQLDGNWTEPMIECVQDHHAWDCTAPMDPVEIAFILDATNSISASSYQDQLRFFESLTMQLHNVTSCPHITCYSHAVGLDFLFSSHEANTSSEVCRQIDGLGRIGGVGNYAIHAVQDSLSIFNASAPRSGFVIVITDRRSNDVNSNWSLSLGTSVLQQAESLNVVVISIDLTRSQTRVATNHHVLAIQGTAELDSLIDPCLDIIANN